MLSGLTEPTRGRVALWISLSVLWALFLPQQIAKDPNFDNFSIPGAIFWVIVLAALVGMAVTTSRRRARLVAQPDNEPALVGGTGLSAAGAAGQETERDHDEPSQLA